MLSCQCLCYYNYFYLVIKDKRLFLRECVFCSASTIPMSSICPTKCRTWTLSDLEFACSVVIDGISIRQAAEKYQISKSMLQDHVSGKVMSCSKSGQRYLTETEEEELVSFILETAKIGFPRARKEVLSLVQIAVKQKGKNVTLSIGWWEGFKKWHSEISLQKATCQYHAATCTSDVLSNYFYLLEQTVLDNGEVPGTMYEPFSSTGMLTCQCFCHKFVLLSRH